MTRWIYYRFQRGIDSGDTKEWWRTNGFAAYGRQVEFSGDGGVSWQVSILPTTEAFLADCDGNAVMVDAPAGVVS